jgi:hypothetical protein
MTWKEFKDYIDTELESEGISQDVKVFSIELDEVELEDRKIMILAYNNNSEIEIF